MLSITTLQFYKQILAFYDALKELGKELPRAYYPDEEEEDLLGTENYIPHDLYGIKFDRARYEFKWQLDAVFDLKAALKEFAALLNDECKSQKAKDTYGFYLSLELIHDKAVKVYEAYCQINSLRAVGWLERYIYRAVERIGANNTICFASGDEVDQLIYAMGDAMGALLQKFFDDPHKAFRYMQLIDKIESCPEGPGIIKALELALDAKPTTEEEE